MKSAFFASPLRKDRSRPSGQEWIISRDCLWVRAPGWSDQTEDRAVMVDDLDLGELRRLPRISYYFRYPLHRHDFRELKTEGRLRGHYAAKPLYGSLLPSGHVNRSAGYNGDIVALFIPIEAQTVHAACLIFAHIAPERIVLTSSRRNWPAIREAAERSICMMLDGGIDVSILRGAFSIGASEVK